MLLKDSERKTAILFSHLRLQIFKYILECGYLTFKTAILFYVLYIRFHCNKHSAVKNKKVLHLHAFILKAPERNFILLVVVIVVVLACLLACRHPGTFQARVVTDRTGQVVMLRAAFLLLGLVAALRAEFAPPTLNISLDEDPEKRWLPLSKVFTADYLKKAAAEIIE